MTPRGAGAAAWWADRYTRGLAPEVRDGRRAEIASDVHEQLADGGRGGAVVWRTVRGVHADLAWRREERRLMQVSHRPTGLRATWCVVTQNWFAPLAVLVGVFDVLTAIAVATDDEGKMPGQAIGPVILTVLALVLFGGLWLRWRAGSARAALPAGAPREAVSARLVAGLVGALVVSLAVLVLGVSAGGRVYFFAAFVILAVTAAGLGGIGIVRAVRATDPGSRIALADGMIIVGVLPALALFWMIVPAVVALAVIVGVVTTNPRVQPAV